MDRGCIPGLVGWVRRAALGDEQALEDLLAGLYTPLLRFLMSRLRGHPDRDDLAQDLAQETLLRVCGSVARCRADTDAQVMAWVLKIARNVIADHVRSPSWLAEALLADEVDLDSVPKEDGEDWNPAGSDEEDVIMTLLGRVIIGLPEELACLLWLHLVQRASWAEIGTELGTSPEGAKRRFQRAQKSLRTDMLRRIEGLSESERKAIPARYPRISGERVFPT